MTLAGSSVLVWGLSFALLAVVAILFWFKPLWAVVLALSTRPIVALFRFAEFDLGPLRLNVLGVYSLTMIALAVTWQLLNKRLSIPANLGCLMACILLYSSASLVYSLSPAAGAGDLFRIVTAFIFLYLLYNLVENKHQVVTLLKWIVLGSTVPIAIGIYQALTNTGYLDPHAEIMRIKSTFVLPTVYAHYLVTISFLLICLILLKENHKRILYMILLGLALISLMLTWGRTSMVAFLCGLLTLAFLKKRRIISFSLVALAGMVLIITVPQLKNRFTEPFQKTRLGKSSWESRKNIWRKSIKAFKKKPILGYGIGSTPLVVQKALKIPRPYQAHNDYFRILLDLGVVGLVLFALLMLAFLSRLTSLFRNEKDPAALELHRLSIALLCSFCIAGMAENVLLDVTSTMYVFSTVGCSLKLGSISEGAF
jgi:O-antigen ligase